MLGDRDESKRPCGLREGDSGGPERRLLQAGGNRDGRVSGRAGGAAGDGGGHLCRKGAAEPPHAGSAQFYR